MDSFFFESPSFTTGAFRVVSIFGEEGMSTPFHFDVVALAVDLEADDVEDKVLGRPARLQLRQHDGGLRSFVGIVRSVRAEGGVGVTRRVRLELVPALFYIGLRHRNRIFQDLSVPKIVEELLGELNVRFEFRLTREYASRDYCVQYQESDADFITRILSDEGIFYFFQSDDVSTTMVFGDKDTAYGPIAGDPGIKNRDGEISANEETISAFLEKRSVRPGSVVLRDYDFKRPSLDQTVQVAVPDPTKPDSPGALERYEFPGGYVEPADGKVRANVRLEELTWDALVASAQSTSRRLDPGHTFLLEEHPRESLNRKYVVTRVRHEGHESAISLSGGGATAGAGAAQFTYRAAFECAPAEKTFRPPRIPRRSVNGIETARVQAEGGSEEILVDEFGRIRVQFPWDREGAKKARTSSFIRVAHAWSGTAFGVVFLPRVGMEVVVSFLGGDPDQPLITGCVYNGEHPHPYKLPENKTRSTIKTQSSPGGNGFNELRFEDKAHAEEIFVHAQKDMNEVVLNNHSVAVGADESINVGHNQDIEIKHSQTLYVHVNQDIEIDGNRTDTIRGNVQTTIEGTNDVTVVKDESVMVKASRTHEIDVDDVLVVHGDRAVSVDDTDSLDTKKKEDHIHTSYDIIADAKFQLIQGGITLLCQDGTMMSHAANVLTVADANCTTTAAAEWMASGTKHATVVSAAKVTLAVGDSQIEVTPGGVKISTGTHINLFGTTVTVQAATSLALKGATIDLDAGVIAMRGLIKLNA